jgi:hypothetical protein
MSKGNALINVNPDISIVRPSVQYRICHCAPTGKQGIGITLRIGGYEASYATHA